MAGLLPSLSRGAAPRFDQALERCAELGILELWQLYRFAHRARHGAQFRALATAEASIHKAQLADDVVAEALGDAAQNLRLHQIQFLYPHRARHFHDRGMELERDDFGPPRDRFTDDLRPGFGESDDREVTFTVEAIEERLHRGADLLRSLVASGCHELSRIAPRSPLAYRAFHGRLTMCSGEPEFRAKSISSANFKWADMI